jgi:hypothetical protein
VVGNGFKERLTEVERLAKEELSIPGAPRLVELISATPKLAEVKLKGVCCKGW